MIAAVSDGAFANKKFYRMHEFMDTVLIKWIILFTELLTVLVWTGKGTFY